MPTSHRKKPIVRDEAGYVPVPTIVALMAAVPAIPAVAVWVLFADFDSSFGILLARLGWWYGWWMMIVDGVVAMVLAIRWAARRIRAVAIHRHRPGGARRVD